MVLIVLPACPDFPDYLLRVDQAVTRPDQKQLSDAAQDVVADFSMMDLNAPLDGPLDSNTGIDWSPDAPASFDGWRDGPIPEAGHDLLPGKDTYPSPDISQGDVLGQDHSVADVAPADGPPSDGTPCPPGCSSCAGGICYLKASDCVLSCVCPAGASCAIDCSSTNACPTTVDCSQAKDCQITCGPGSCQKEIMGGTGQFSLQCLGPGACNKGIDCQQAQSCEVICQDTSCEKEIFCGNGSCQVTCQNNSCKKEITCPLSCRCSVTCDGTSCDKSITCPPNCQSGTGCDPLLPGCQPAC